LIKSLEVEVNGNIEDALKRLKRKMANEGVFKDIKKRRYYEKPSARKKRKKEESRRRLIKRIRRLEARFSDRKKYRRR